MYWVSRHHQQDRSTWVVLKFPIKLRQIAPHNGPSQGTQSEPPPWTIPCKSPTMIPSGIVELDSIGSRKNGAHYRPLGRGLH